MTDIPMSSLSLCLRLIRVSACVACVLEESVFLIIAVVWGRVDGYDL